MNESYVRTRKKVNMFYINIKNYVICHEKIVTVSAYFFSLL
jgi:hypothetical protein